MDILKGSQGTVFPFLNIDLPKENPQSKRERAIKKKQKIQYNDFLEVAMMAIRKRVLPAGWYPKTEGEVLRQINIWEREGVEELNALSAIIPHAGWFFSGSLAWRGIRALTKEADTVVVLGGHLRKTDRILAAPEESYETPLGELQADKELKRYLASSLDLGEDFHADNTVEIQLPLVKAAFPKAKGLWLRVPPSDKAGILGQLLTAAEEKLSRRIVVLGSTDLTHYGPNYGFQPEGRSKGAVQWVKEVNDKRIIDSFLSMNSPETLRRAAVDYSACSAGAAIAALERARGAGISRGTLLGYFTSYDIDPAESFVGYAAVAYFK